MVYSAEPRSHRFCAERHANCPWNRLPLIAARKQAASSDVNNLFLDLAASEEGCRCYVVEATGGEILAVLNKVLNLPL